MAMIQDVYIETQADEPVKKKVETKEKKKQKKNKEGIG